jgi:hypothetical protein
MRAWVKYKQSAKERSNGLQIIEEVQRSFLVVHELEEVSLYGQLVFVWLLHCHINSEDGRGTTGSVMSSVIWSGEDERRTFV